MMTAKKSAWHGIGTIWIQLEVHYTQHVGFIRRVEQVGSASVLFFGQLGSCSSLKTWRDCVRRRCTLVDTNMEKETLCQVRKGINFTVRWMDAPETKRSER